jgi:uncharacterized protein YkwD
MASTGTLEHNPNLVSQITCDWIRLGENVGFGPTVAFLQDAFMNSPSHRANILGDFTRVGVGAVRGGDGTIWVVVDLVNSADACG